MSRSVLIVDDDEDFRTIVGDGLRTRGHEVHSVGSAASAVKHVASNRPEIVLVDIVLPDQNGFNLARDLRRIVPDALIMGVTAYPRAPTPEQLDCGIACMFLKPCETAEIARLIEGWNPPRAR